MKSISDYTKNDFIKLITEIMNDRGSEEYQDELLDQFIELSEHPSGSDLIYYPDTTESGTREGIAEIVQTWRKTNGEEGFKDS